MKFISSIIFTLLISSILVAQNRSIDFVDNDFAAAKAKAKQQNKLLFVDAYTTWCGPC